VVHESITSGAQILLTTAKDEVKLRKLRFEMLCYAADIEIEIENVEQFSYLIQESLNQE
jgi:tetraacyldisaccharide-1-P 4'-kinase